MRTVPILLVVPLSLFFLVERASTFAPSPAATTGIGSIGRVCSSRGRRLTDDVFCTDDGALAKNHHADSHNHLHHQRRRRQRFLSRAVPPLFMGRAAAVRASTKAKTDMKKAKTNAVYGKKIIMAVKEGGSPDPNANRALADVIKQAKANNVPVDNINRAIKKASESNVGDFKSSTFEAYGVGGASLIIHVLSDNPNRATADVRSTVNKRNGKMAESGSVLFMYDHKGKIALPANTDLDEEALLEAAIEADVDDYEVVMEEGEEEDDGEAATTTVIYTDPKEVALMFEAVQGMGITDGVIMSLNYISKAPVECTDEDFEKNMGIIDALEDLDDVDSVEHNMSN